jgi:hypothetical protein
MGRLTKKQQLSKKLSLIKTKWNDEIISKLRTAFAFDCTIEEACLYAGIDVVTFWRHTKKNPKLRKEFDALRNTPILKARQAVIKSFEQDPNLALKYLERKRRQEFALRQEITGEDGQAIKIEIEIDKDIQKIQEQGQEQENEN